MIAPEKRTPSEVFSKPVLGRITAQLVLKQEDGTVESWPAETFEFIETKRDAGEITVYVTNRWHEPGVVQFVPAAFVTDVEWYGEPV